MACPAEQKKESLASRKAKRFRSKPSKPLFRSDKRSRSDVKVCWSGELWKVKTSRSDVKTADHTGCGDQQGWLADQIRGLGEGLLGRGGGARIGLGPANQYLLPAPGVNILSNKNLKCSSTNMASSKTGMTHCSIAQPKKWDCLSEALKLYCKTVDSKKKYKTARSKNCACNKKANGFLFTPLSYSSCSDDRHQANAWSKWRSLIRSGGD